MKFKKTVLQNIKNCYVANEITINDERYYVYAPDDLGPAYSFKADDYSSSKIWDEPGGTMSLVPLPNVSNGFLATQNFLPIFKAKNSKIVKIKKTNNGWDINDWVNLSYLHRFDILQRGGQYYLLACILSETKGDTVNWDIPGSLLVSQLDLSFSSPKKFKKIGTGMHYNHGYFKFTRDGYDCALTASQEGVFEVVPPSTVDGDWLVSKILDKPSSEAQYIDIDEDGIEELIVIEPFHGDQLVIYKKMNNKYEEIYRHNDEMDFLHALWSGNIYDKPTIIAGYRNLKKKLFMIQFEEEKFVTKEIDVGFGPSNLVVTSYQGIVRLLVANRESDQAALYEIFEER